MLTRIYKMEGHKGFITQEGLLVPVRVLRARLGDAYTKFLKKLTLTHRPKVGPPKSIKLYKTKNRGDEDYIYLPRVVTKLLYPKIITELDVALPPIRRIAECPMQLELFETQQIVIRRLLELFTEDRMAAGTAIGLLNLRAGLGKTYVAAELISRLRLRTLYVVPKIPLATQAVQDLRNCLYPTDGKPPITIGKYRSKPKVRDLSTDHTKQDVTVIVINSAVAQDLEFFAGYSLVIFDEAHTYCSDVNRKIFRLCGAPAMLGMSATTEDRRDGFDAVVHKELAYDGIIRAEDIPGFNYDDVNFEATVNIIRYNGPPEYTKTLIHESTGKVFTPFMHKQFLQDPFRTTLAIQCLRKLYDWRGPEGQVHCIYVFCEEVDPLKIIYQGFMDTFGEEAIAAPEIGHFTGGIKEKQITEMRNNARIFLTTYGYSGTGVSIDKMTAIIFLTSRRANMKQIIPRILRRSGDQSIRRVIYDIVDNKTSMKYQLGDRMLAYNYYGMDIEVTKVDASKSAVDKIKLFGDAGELLADVGGGSDLVDDGVGGDGVGAADGDAATTNDNSNM